MKRRQKGNEGAGSTPSGSVAFKDGRTALGTVSRALGTTSLATTSLGLGSHSIVFRRRKPSSVEIISLIWHSCPPDGPNPDKQTHPELKKWESWSRQVGKMVGVVGL